MKGSCSERIRSTRAWSMRRDHVGVLLGVADALGEREARRREEHRPEAEEGADPRVDGEVEDREDHGQQRDGEGDAGLQEEGVGVLGRGRGGHGSTVVVREARTGAAGLPDRGLSTGAQPFRVRSAHARPARSHDARGVPPPRARRHRLDRRLLGLARRPARPRAGRARRRTTRCCRRRPPRTPSRSTPCWPTSTASSCPASRTGSTRGSSPTSRPTPRPPRSSATSSPAASAPRG